METQHIKYTECIFGKPNNYMWLCSKKPHMVYWMSTKDEIKIRNCLDRVSSSTSKELQVSEACLPDHSGAGNQSSEAGAHLFGQQPERQSQ